MRRMSSGVRATLSGSRAGSPTGSEPGGSSRAARCPCIRWAFTSEVAACTAWSRAGSGAWVAAGIAAAGTGSSAGGGRGPGALHAAAQRDRFEDALVEAVGALEELVDPAQERARLGALDDAVVVGARHGHDLLHAELAEPLRLHRAEAGWIADRPGGDDRALAGHEAWHRRDRAEPAGVGERHVRALVGVGRE